MKRSLSHPLVLCSCILLAASCKNEPESTIPPVGQGPKIVKKSKPTQRRERFSASPSRASNALKITPVSYKKVTYSPKPTDQFEIEVIDPELTEEWKKIYPEVNNIPIWKRLQVMDVKQRYENLLDSGRDEAKKIKALPSAERRKWNRRWSTENKPKLKQLKDEEQRLINFPAHELEFTEAQIEEIQLKIITADSKFSIEDIAMLEAILAPAPYGLVEDAHLIVEKKKLRARYQDLILYHKSPEMAARNQKIRNLKK